jgi:hypothetical protein
VAGDVVVVELPVSSSSIRLGLAEMWDHDGGRRTKERRSARLMLVVGLLGAVVSWRAQEPPVGIALWVVSAPLVAWGLLKGFDRIVIAMHMAKTRQQRAVLEDVTVTADDSGITAVTVTGARTHWPWHAGRLINADQALLFCPTPISFIRIPKALLQARDADQIVKMADIGPPAANESDSN